MLLEHNISNELIDMELSKIDKSFYYEKINKIIDKKVKSNKKYSQFVLKQKIVNDLKNQGFNYDDINECIENIKVNNNSLIEKYYDKIFNKLSVKYDKDILYIKVKEKLYQKGFSSSEINEIFTKKIG